MRKRCPCGSTKTEEWNFGDGGKKIHKCNWCGRFFGQGIPKHPKDISSKFLY
tara:strand:- start:167 stop:322 length:156 start_codon:yes stop_codon:yes gene_type:complete